MAERLVHLIKLKITTIVTSPIRKAVPDVNQLEWVKENYDFSSCCKMSSKFCNWALEISNSSRLMFVIYSGIGCSNGSACLRSEVDAKTIFCYVDQRDVDCNIRINNVTSH